MLWGTLGSSVKHTPQSFHPTPPRGKELRMHDSQHDVGTAGEILLISSAVAYLRSWQAR